MVETTDMLDIIIFDVEHGQSIFFYPRTAPQYGMFVDCGNTPQFEPVDFLIEKGLLHHDGRRHTLGGLTITNYDHDHFSGLPYLREKAHIWTVVLANNLTSADLKALKPERTTALEHVCYLKDTYTLSPVPDFAPPYTQQIFSLQKAHLDPKSASTNNLSQLVFVEYGGSAICVAGDLEEGAWDKLVEVSPGVKAWLAKTNVLVAGHHGRESGYAESIFAYCTPECVAISDKGVVHDTQDAMAQTYASHVIGDGIPLNGAFQKRKVVTTRSDGHIWIRFVPGGGREYRTL